MGLGAANPNPITTKSTPHLIAGDCSVFGSTHKPAGDGVEVRLPIGNFHGRGEVLVAQSKVKSKSLCDSEIVLRLSTVLPLILARNTQ